MSVFFDGAGAGADAVDEAARVAVGVERAGAGAEVRAGTV